MWKRISFSLAIATIITVVLAGSIAFGATDAGSSTVPAFSTEPASSTEPAPSIGSAYEWAKFRNEGIPMPIVDASVDGWFKYLGNGDFITQFGRTFSWRDGHFVNPDGTTLELPPSAKEHLNSLGIYRQPTAEDMAKDEEIRATSSGQDAAAGKGTLAPASWAGDYLHVGKTYTGQSHVGTQADITITDRSHGYAEYYGVGLHASNYDGDFRVGLEVCDMEGTYPNTTWLPIMHAIMDWVDIPGSPDDDLVWEFTSFTFMTGEMSPATKNLKLALKSSGYVWPYIDGQNAAYDVLFLGDDVVSSAESAYEIGSDDRFNAPHDPANHHYNIKNQHSVGGAWSLQTDSISKWNTILGNGTEYSPVYDSNWIINANYNWMAHPL